MKQILIAFSTLGLILMLISCNGSNSHAPSYDGFDSTVEQYFVAATIKDFDTMKEYLPEALINEDQELLGAEKGEILFPQYKEKLKDNYSIKGFDYYYKDFNQILYLIEYTDPVTSNRLFSIYGVENKKDGYQMMNRYDLKISGLHFKEETSQSTITVSDLRELMEKHKNHVYSVDIS
ncbi:hypothetical protein [Cytobacillus horneckiae]|uniref:Uncharacterized protein n=1 Tax=Cytobacillus horneckiae TaxID=549687 RepID=A0A2N0ZB03_9BACI|nr:hypothetical protein [Cytobacillus horneckiae]MEC1158699.1 hypothetical protein [Cytobacillus horneckiae]NRG46657.1 hypothetical protein [Bacillus sp. CRN 9]PKG26690.1 hypothetical protein CWS20_22855 [Cytobacillus horneckiae]